MSVIKTLAGRGVAVRGNDLDTDRVVPARFLKEITFENMGNYLFYDVRFEADATPKEHPLNDLRFKDASVMVVNKNFGCGSSREHAPQAIKRAGFDLVVGESFAEIFAGNCQEIGVVAVSLGEAEIEALQGAIEADETLEISVDIEARTLSYAGQTLAIELPETRRQAFLTGAWDVLGQLKANAQQTAEKHRSLPYLF